jgi:uncharacterized membrane protein HdeD (DUF308 family)
MSIYTRPGASNKWMEPITQDWWLYLVWGIAAVILGVLLFTQPVGSAIVLVTLAAIFWFVGGIVEVVAALWHRGPSWGWHLAAGILSILVALYVFANPALGTLAAVSVLYLLIAFAALVNGCVGLFAWGGEHSLARILLSILQVVFGILMLAGFFNILNLVALVQAIGLVTIFGGIVAAIAAFGFRSTAPAAT